MKLNNKGAMTIILLVLLSSIFVVMMGTAGIKLLEAGKNLQKHNEAYKYLVVMEELGQAVARARSLGRNTECIAHPVTPATTNPTAAMYQAACPANTRHLWVAAPVPKTLCPGHPRGITLQIQNRYALCVPDRNGNAAVDAVEFCAQIEGFNYCLSGGPFNQNLRRLDLNNEATSVDLGRPGILAEPPGASFQQTNGGSLQPRNNTETWSPSVAWADTNEMYTTTCGTYASAAENDRYWLGCHFCNDPRHECWVLRMCPRVPVLPLPGIPGAGACPAGESPATQRIVLYFENNRPN